MINLILTTFDSSLLRHDSAQMYSCYNDAYMLYLAHT